MDAVIRLVAGLGNPGKAYERTRHNVGFLVLDELARRKEVEFQSESKWNADIAKACDVVLMKPATYMNLSGYPVASYSRFFKFAAEEILIVLDDAALSLGRIRLRKSGSSGGHNGLESVIAHLGTQEVPRLRFGIGSAAMSLHDHVLGRFTSSELEQVSCAISTAADAADWACKYGVESAMNRFNASTN